MSSLTAKFKTFSLENAKRPICPDSSHEELYSTFKKPTKHIRMKGRHFPFCERCGIEVPGSKFQDETCCADVLCKKCDHETRTELSYPRRRYPSSKL